MHVTTVSWHLIPFSLCCFAVLRFPVLCVCDCELLLSKRDTMANSEACYTIRGTANRKKSSVGVAATESFPERCCLGVPVVDTFYQLPTARAPGQPAATA
ncbi:Hemoglobin subunit [Trichinella spiralis]|nr:hypothetical protein Tsp_04485 [Trichinella spiralis]